MRFAALLTFAAKKATDRPGKSGKRRRESPPRRGGRWERRFLIPVPMKEDNMLAVIAPLVLVLAGPIDAEKGFLGVQLKQTDAGIEVQSILPDSPADKAGLRMNDIILKMNGDDVGAMQNFVKSVGTKKPGDKIKLKIKRDDKEKEIEVTLGKMPEQDKP
jgi:S1-C subfamily serine protease